LQHIRKTLPTKLAGIKISVRGLHRARGPVVGPRWYRLFLISTQAPNFSVIGQYVTKSILLRFDLILFTNGWRQSFAKLPILN